MTAIEPIWSDPDVEDLGEGLFRIPLPLPNDGLRAVNVYALCDDDDVTLIDGGWAFEGSEHHLVTALHGIGYDLGQIRRILVTHLHRDHYSQAVTIREKVGSLVGLGEDEGPNFADVLESIIQQRPTGSLGPLQRAGAQVLMRPPGDGSDRQDPRLWTTPDEWLRHDQVLEVGRRSLRAISTPGHTAGHLVFREDARKLLFAGDHVLPHITPSIGFEPSPTKWPLQSYLDSLNLMLQLPDARLLPAHGPVSPSVHVRVNELLAHHEQRLSDTYAVVRAGAATGYDVASRLLWTRRGRSFADLDLFNQRLATCETAAHLDVLVLQGRLTSATGESGVEYYQTRD